jgi:hypothetical protein
MDLGMGMDTNMNTDADINNYKDTDTVVDMDNLDNFFGHGIRYRHTHTFIK